MKLVDFLLNQILYKAERRPIVVDIDLDDKWSLKLILTATKKEKK